MRYLIVLLVIACLTQCKFIESSTGSSGPSYAPATGPHALTGQQCFINAKVLMMLDTGVYELRVYQIMKQSKTFSQPLSPGDKISLHTPIILQVDSEVDLSIEWEEYNGGGGRYIHSSSAE
ncbi:hypothetical protein [Marinoscillum sp. MHG1-6]|uniref:hypothetical protein n=1 Tax=Marinoscillum sp. MHG1-6 TaxID=2959627 RepID=UPI0021576AA4|nr:hypothetical protein [Marinoscillum sp. MHG1-6]